MTTPIGHGLRPATDDSAANEYLVISPLSSLQPTVICADNHAHNLQVYGSLAAVIIQSWRS